MKTNVKLILKKLSIARNEQLIRRMCRKAGMVANGTGKVAVAYFEYQFPYLWVKKWYPNYDVYYIDEYYPYNNIDKRRFIKVNYGDIGKEWLDMHFDKVIMNPPYNGTSHLYIKLTAIAKEHADKVVCLSPALDYYSFGTKGDALKDRNKLAPYFKGYTSENKTNEFGATFDKDLYILEFENTNAPLDFSELFFDRLLNKELTKQIFEKFKAYNSLEGKLNTSLDEIKKWPYNCYIASVRGHRNQETGKYIADWTTLFNPSIMYEFEEYKGDSKSVRSFGFNTKEECLNFVNYCDSDIFMFAYYLMKTSIKVNSINFRYVPCMPIYTKAWTDEEIAQEIGLTDEEVAYIHEEMKDFGYKAMGKK